MFYLQRRLAGVSSVRRMVSALLLMLSGPYLQAATYYANDASTNGDVYCAAVGSDANSGLSNNAPKLTLTNLLASVSLVSGDTVYVDTGIYSNYTVTLTASGTGTNRITVQGSTNYMAGGTVVDRRNTAVEALVFNAASSIRLADFTIRGGSIGVYFFNNTNCELERVTSVSNTRGFLVQSATGHRVLRSVTAFNATGMEFSNPAGVQWDQGVSWSNTTAFNLSSGVGTLMISNSAVVGGTAFLGQLPAAMDYNVFYNTVLFTNIDTVSDFAVLRTNAFRSTWANPQFANPAGLDFHPLSVQGRYNPATGLWVTDAVHSVLIDFGDYNRAYATESAPNGSNMNAGLFGNLPEASNSRTNPWLQALTFNDGGQLNESGTVYWTYGALTNGSTVSLQVSLDGGGLWSNMVVGLPVTNRSYPWAVTNLISTPRAYWRVVNEGDTNVADSCDTNFVLRVSATNTFSFFVNDASTSGDGYCSAVGSATNSGVSAGSPRASLQDIVDSYDLNPGDVVYVDTGIYTGSVSLTYLDRGISGKPVSFVGSTNDAVGGTVLEMNSTVLDTVTANRGANFLSFAHLTTRRSRYGFSLNQVNGLQLTRVISMQNSRGFFGANLISTRFQQCAAVSNTVGVDINSGSSNLWDQGVSMSNTTAFTVGSATLLSISNSVVSGGNAAFSGMIVSSNFDFNVLWNVSLGGGFSSLYDLQKARNKHWGCTYGDPVFGDPTTLDFHPRSQTGRFSPGTSSFVTDVVHSILVDFGDPTRSVGAETTPNGGRLNAGLFGGTDEASRSLTNAWLLAMSLNDGGQLSVGDAVYWTYGGLSTSATVRVEYSSDSGSSWSIVSTNLAVTNGFYSWTSTNFSSSIYSRWRVVYESDTNVLDASDSSFTLRNGGFKYYLNDDSTAGDQYTSGLGSDTNLGTSVALPKRSLTNLLFSMDLEPGDIVYVDTGVYRSSVTPVWGSADSGVATNPVLVYASTNWLSAAIPFDTNWVAGGTIFDRQGSGHGVHFSGASYVTLRGLVVTNASSGVRIESSTGIRLENVSARAMSDSGIRVISSPSTTLSRVAAYLNTSNGIYVEASVNVTIQNSVLWRNAGSGLRVDSGYATLTGSVVVSSSSLAPLFRVATLTNVLGDFNNLWNESNAPAALISNPLEQHDSVAVWQGRTAQSQRSLNVNPLFAQPLAGDFHVLTQTAEGRYDPTVGALVSDSLTSLMIDSGDPALSFTNEPSPNGSRVDIGLYGNSAEASRGRNTPWLHAASAAAGGAVRGTATLAWVAGNFTNATTVRVDVSRDGGSTWAVLSNEVLASSVSVRWDTTLTADTPAGAWRVVSLSDTNVFDQTTNFFSIRNAALSIYLNDGAVTGDVYTTAAGAATNWEASATQPFNSLAGALARYDVEPGDTIYMDTGTYNDSTNMALGRLDAGYTGQVVRVLGSTNSSLGSVIYRGSTAGTAFGLQVQDARWVALSNLTFRGGGRGVSVTNSSDLVLSVRVMQGSNGVMVGSSTNISLRRASAVGNTGRGFTILNSTNIAFDHALAWSNAMGSINLVGARVTATNSIFTAHGTGRYVYEGNSTNDVVIGDYNNLLVSSPAQMMLQAGRAYKFLGNVQATFNTELHSLSHTPDFADASVGDFHLKSTLGRWSPSLGWTTDTVHSVLIDAGRPSDSAAAEPSPNGDRVNLGLYGGSGVASLSDTNGRLLALTFNDGGTVRGTNTIYWLVTGAVTGDQVYVDFSADGGLTWTNIGTNLSASTGSLVWDTTIHGSTPAGVWRITSQSSTAQTSQTATRFSLNNGALTYYVNDASTNGDVYCTVVGSSVNDGSSPSSPLDSVGDILTRYSLSAGDHVLMDTGVYTVPGGLLFDNSLLGQTTNRIVIQGSTNEAAGGTVVDGANGGYGIYAVGPSGLAIRDLHIRHAQAGVYLFGTTNCLMDRVKVEGAGGFNTDEFAFDVRYGTNLIFRNCVAAGITNASGRGAALRVRDLSTAYWDNGVMWSNKVCAELGTARLFVSNTSFSVFSREALVYSIGIGSTVLGNYNNFHLVDGALLAQDNVFYVNPTISAPVYYDTLDLWNRATSNDLFSLSHDPLFADPASRDFHLMSQGGRWAPGTGVVFDAVTSPLLDAGSPAAAYSNEPAPNGDRLDIGAFGHHEEASQTPTNARLVTVTLNGGGIASSATQFLYWVQSGAATGHLKTLAVSLDNGFSWTTLVSGVSAGVTSYTWNTTSWFSEPDYRWRISSETEPTVVDEADTLFALRNSNVVYYVNDNSITGDVYCSNVGNAFNSGLVPTHPKSQLSEILEAYNVEPGDTIYLDTGIYYPTNYFNLTQVDAGAGTNLVSILGSTNDAAGGTRIRGAGLRSDAPRGVLIQDLEFTITGAVRDVGVQLAYASNATLRRITVRGTPGNGLWSKRSMDVRIDRSVVVGAVTNGYFDDASRNVIWQNGILWSNQVGIRAEGSGLTVSNSVLVALASGQLPYFVGGTMTSDYNCIYVTNGAQVANEYVTGRVLPLQYETLGRWSRDSGRERFSLPFHPRFVDPPTDFHPVSTMGRYSVAVTGFVVDASTSPLVDAGHPAGTYANEIAPNGYRVNMGLYGDTAQASLTPTTAVLQAVSLSDGGIAGGTNQFLYWLARGDATGYSVRIEFSPDGGVSWFSVVTNLPAATSTYTWNTTNYASTVLGYWRVVAEGDTNVADVTDSAFALRNGSVLFYVNDSETAGDMYCSAPGLATNTGVSAANPISSMATLLSQYDVEPGDVIYIDTGSYNESTSISIGQLDSGVLASNAFVLIQGSTNVAAGGSVLQGPSGDPVFSLFDTQAIRFRDLVIRADASSSAILARKSSGLRFERVTTHDGQYGFEISESSDVTWLGCIARNHTKQGLAAGSCSGLMWDQGVFWSNAVAGASMTASQLSISNSAFGVFASSASAYSLDHVSTLASDYNSFLLTNGALMGQQSLPAGDFPPALLLWQSVSRWARDTGRDRFSLVADPLFADAPNGQFHLRSAAGRYDPSSGLFTNDVETSPLIDAGSPFAVYTNESANNGGRVNIGPHGNTALASRSPTDAVLRVVSLYDGGRAEGSSWPLYWLARGAATGHTVRLEYAGSTADVWSVLATNLPARTLVPYFWDTTPYTSTVMALWRVVSETDGSLAATSAVRFAVRNQALAFYVNDNAVSGDVYCATAGAANLSGTSPEDPRDSLQTILDDYDLEPGDTVYLDTGIYELNQQYVQWGRFDAWDQMTNMASLAAGGSSVMLKGSTNQLGGGSIFNTYQSVYSLIFSQAMGVAVQDLAIRHLSAGSGTGLELYQSWYASVTRVTVATANRGFYVNDSDGVVLRNCLARGNADAGLYTGSSDDTRWYSGVLWSNVYGVFQNDGDGNTLTVQDTALGAFGVGSFGYLKVKGTLTTDYNNLYRSGGGFAAGVLENGVLGGGTTRYETVTSWVNGSGNDSHTLSSDPKFASATDYHLQSPAGRYVIGTGYFTNLADAISPLLDAGNPASTYSQETAPNGNRINIGLYGNTTQSSLSPSNGLLTAITFSDGGSGQGSIDLRWNAGGAATSHLVRLEFSNNGGATWTNIASNVVASLGTYAWNSVPYGRAAAGLWRVVSQSDPSVLDASDAFFALRNGGSIPYFVNDGSTAGDVYCTAVGSDANDGYLPSTPKATIQNLIDSTDLEAGDVIYVDTGTFLLSAPVLVGDLDAGSPTNYVSFRGSTNMAAGGTVLDRQTSSGYGLHLMETVGVEFRDMKIINAGYGVFTEKSDGCRLVNIRSTDHTVAAFASSLSATNLFEGCVASSSSNGLSVSSSTMAWRNGVIWDNLQPVVLGPGGGASFYNTVIQAVGSSVRIFSLDEAAGNVSGDYNDFVREEDALLYERTRAVGGNEIYARLSEWQHGATQDLHSLTHDPMFVADSAGDFHLRSSTGRFLDDGTLTNDTAGLYSPLLDTGHPGFVYTNETAPNGDRINIGIYGNTAFASLSQTNPWLLALSYNDGGLIRGTTSVYWAFGGLTNGATVRLEQAPDGVDFTPFASNILANTDGYTWNVSAIPVTSLARWRVVLESDPSVLDANDDPILIKNQNLIIFVNDGDLSGDAYCTAIGDPTNSGLLASAPVHDPGFALEKFDLGPEDVMYIDTGTYSLTNEDGMVIGLVGSFQEVGLTNQPIRIIGSTNFASGGTTILPVPTTNAFGLTIQNTRFIEVDNLNFSGGGVGVQVVNAPYIALRHIHCSEHASDGFRFLRSSPVFMSYCASWGNTNYGVYADTKSTAAFDHGVVWSNRAGAVFLFNSGWQGSNSILGTFVTNTYLVRIEGPSSLVEGDYNMYWTRSGARIGYEVAQQVFLANLRSWQLRTAADEHSAVLDPALHAPEAGDFHLRSRMGRYDPGTFGFVSGDAQTSWAIDAGDPTSAFTNEPAPNGSRLNLGLHGDTDEASMTETNPAYQALQVISLDDGGQVTTNIYLRWLAQGFSTSDTVYVEYSVDNGGSWVALATNLPASAGEVYWIPVASNSSPVGYWRVASVSNSLIASTNDVNFAIRVTPVTYYVNDTSTVGDVYCVAPGDPLNNGLSSNTPLTSLQEVLDRYDLDQGDRVLLDTGYFPLESSARILPDDGGVVSNPVFIIGSTNWMQGGTIFDRQSTNLGSLLVADAALETYQANYLDISHLAIRGANVGLQIYRPLSITFSNMLITDGGRTGVELTEGAKVYMSRVAISHQLRDGLLLSACSEVSFDSGVIWSNGGNAISLQGSTISVTGSILHAQLTNYCYSMSEAGSVKGNYNNLYYTDLARPAKAGSLVLEGLPQWTVFSTQDLHSISVDPLFADAATNDFHLRSPAGRFDPGLGGFVMTDTNYSDSVDAGPTNHPFAEEPSPNGNRRNQGLYGNTTEASMGHTNEWLMAVTASSGGRLGGVFNLAWLWGNLAPTSAVALDFSYDGGTNWIRITSNRVVSAGQFLWDSLSQPLAVSPIARWRIMKETDTNVMDMTDHDFALNGPFTFYINDTSTVSDVFSTDVGSDANLGIYAASPKGSLANLLATWDLEGGDSIYLDTGFYPMSTNDIAELSNSDAGQSGASVILRGSTNGALMHWIETDSPAHLVKLQGSHVRMSDLTFSQGGFDAAGTNIVVYNITVTNGAVKLGGANNTLSNVTMLGGTVLSSGYNQELSRLSIRNGFLDMAGELVTLRNSLAWGTQSLVVVASGTNITLRNNTFISGGTAVSVNGPDASVSLRNNILVANGLNGTAFILRRDSGALDSDYNNLVARNSAWFGNAYGLWERLLYWQRASGQDLHSISADPLFADEAGGDFHLKSVSGRYTGAGVVTDTVHSSSIDMGSASYSYSAEPAPNGSRINLGAYGNTPEASRSRTTPWLFAMTMNDGGVLSGTNPLTWASGNLGGGDTVTLRYSPDAGATWTTIVSGVQASLGTYTWISTSFPSSLDALWGLVLDSDTNITDEVDTLFAVRNGPLGFYVNDASVSNDVFASAPGHVTNTGRSALSPKATIQGILDEYDTEGGDVIYVDTGAYSLTNAVSVIWSRGGDPTNGPLVIRGSTNFVAGGSIVSRNTAVVGADAIEVKASHVRLLDFTISGAYRGVLIDSNANTSVERMLLVSNRYGVVAQKSTRPVVRNNRLWDLSDGGVDVNTSFSNTVENNTFVGVQPWSIRLLNSSPNILQNNIFAINTTGTTAYAGVLDSASIDYNIYHFTQPGYIYGSSSNLLQWQLTTARDYRSANTNPLLADVTSGDFHLQSSVGRWLDGAGWTTDVVDSWGIDKGSTNSAYLVEPEPNGHRINIGAYGNTEYASLGRTSSAYLVEARVLNNAILISETNATWPLIWTTINVPTTETFRVEFSPDNGVTWHVLSNNVPAYQEFIIWNTSPLYNTYRGRWRIVGISDTNYWDINDSEFQVFYGQFKITEVAESFTTNRITWRGAWAEYYQVQYTTNILNPDGIRWVNALDGLGDNQRASFLSTNGGDFIYHDMESPTNRLRMYRVLLEQMEP